MHKLVDNVFGFVWRFVPTGAPSFVDYPIARLEYLMHRLANLFEYDSYWS